MLEIPNRARFRVFRVGFRFSFSYGLSNSVAIEFFDIIAADNFIHVSTIEIPSFFLQYFFFPLFLVRKYHV